MNRFLVALEVTLVALILAGCAGGVFLKGKVEEGRYHSPLDNFSMALPKFGDLKIQDRNTSDEGRVSFTGVFGDLWAVTYVRLPADAASIFRDPEKRDRAHRLFLTDYAMPVFIRNASPQSSLVEGQFIDMHGSRAYFAVVNIPGASAIFDPKKNQRLNSVRGLLSFEKNGFQYMLEKEMNHVTNLISASSLTAKQIKNAQESLKRIEENMIFM